MKVDHTASVSGFAGGTLLSVTVGFDLQDIAGTVILASIGAVTSFFVSLACKRLLALRQAPFDGAPFDGGSLRQSSGQARI